MIHTVFSFTPTVRIEPRTEADTTPVRWLEILQHAPTTVLRASQLYGRDPVLDTILAAAEACVPPAAFDDPDTEIVLLEIKLGDKLVLKVRADRRGH